MNADAFLVDGSLMANFGTIRIEFLDQSNGLEELIGIPLVQDIPDYRVILLDLLFLDYRMFRVPIFGGHWWISPNLSPFAVNWLKEFSVT